MKIYENVDAVLTALQLGGYFAKAFQINSSMAWLRCLRKKKNGLRPAMYLPIWYNFYLGLELCIYNCVTKFLAETFQK